MFFDIELDGDLPQYPMYGHHFAQSGIEIVPQHGRSRMFQITRIHHSPSNFENMTSPS